MPEIYTTLISRTMSDTSLKMLSQVISAILELEIIVQIPFPISSYAKIRDNLEACNWLYLSLLTITVGMIL